MRETAWQPIRAAIRTAPADVLDRHAADAAKAAAARGVVGIVDFEAPWQIDGWVRRIGDGCDALRVVASVWPPYLDDAIGRGLRTGARGRIEHAQLLHPADVARFAELGIVASVQPEHAVDDRDVADRFWAGRTDRAFAYRTLLDAGVQLALGSDAPVAPLDPWITIAAAVHRTRGDRPSWHPEQQIPLPAAPAASWGPDGPIRVGRRADLVVTEADPATADSETLRAMPVAATMLGGRWTHRSGI